MSEGTDSYDISDTIIGRAILDQTQNAESVRCATPGCGQIIVQEKDDPWFHDETGEERCWKDRDEFATPPNDSVRQERIRTVAVRLVEQGLVEPGCTFPAETHAAEIIDALDALATQIDGSEQHD